jgi:hypothetical protein
MATNSEMHRTNGRPRRRGFVSLLLAVLTILAPAVAQETKPRERENVQCTSANVKLNLLQPLSTASAKTRDQVPMTFACPLLVGNVLFPKGQIVYARLKKAKHAKKCADGDLAFEDVRLRAGGKTIARLTVQVAGSDRDFEPRSASNQANYRSYYKDTEMSMGWAVVIALDSPFLLAKAIKEHASGKCNSAGRDIDLAAESVVWATVRREP